MGVSKERLRLKALYSIWGYSSGALMFNSHVGLGCTTLGMYGGIKAMLALLEYPFSGYTLGLLPMTPGSWKASAPWTM